MGVMSKLDALERRYNGPIPPLAAMSADYDAEYAEQLRNRRIWAWAEVRRIGRDIVFASREFRANNDIKHYHEWVRLRRWHLRPALESWERWREWHRQQEALAEPAQEKVAS